jgi:hypothetical protein
MWSRIDLVWSGSKVIGDLVVGGVHGCTLLDLVPDFDGTI